MLTLQSWRCVFIGLSERATLPANYVWKLKKKKKHYFTTCSNKHLQSVVYFIFYGLHVEVMRYFMNTISRAQHVYRGNTKGVGVVIMTVFGVRYRDVINKVIFTCILDIVFLFVHVHNITMILMTFNTLLLNANEFDNHCNDVRLSNHFFYI